MWLEMYLSTLHGQSVWYCCVKLTIKVRVMAAKYVTTVVRVLTLNINGETVVIWKSSTIIFRVQYIGIPNFIELH